jgi:hypothetical protein
MTVLQRNDPAHADFISCHFSLQTMVILSSAVLLEQLAATVASYMQPTGDDRPLESTHNRIANVALRIILLAE